MVDKTAMWAVAVKDMRSVVSSIQVWLPMLLIPLLLGVVSPSMMVVIVGFSDLSQLSELQMMIELIDKLKGTELYTQIQTYSTLNQQLVYLMVTYLFTPFFLVIPIVASSVVAANSFVGEKERRTLESLLLSPIDMKSLFLGKVLSAFLPAMLITLCMFLIFGVVITLLTNSLFQESIFPTWDWLVLIGWVVPNVSLFVILFNVMISTKVKGFQEAYQLGSVIVIPIVMLIMSQLSGYFFLDTTKLFAIGVIVLLIDGVMFRWISKGDQRLKLGNKSV